MYSESVEVSRKPDAESSEPTLMSLRAKFMTSDSVDWLLKVPYDVRNSAFHVFDKVCKAFFAEYRNIKATNPDAIVGHSNISV